jgi:hypothetical protein
VTACDLNDRSLDRAHVQVSVRVLYTMHGAATLPDPSCKGRRKIAWAALSYPDAGNPVVDFSIEPGSEEKLRPYYRLQGGSSVACVSLEGQLIVMKGLRSWHVHGMFFGNGFGEEGRARAALVIQRVISASPCDY